MEENGCLINKANTGKIGEKKYLISAIWWREWCDYVNFDFKGDDEREVMLDYRNNIDFKINNNMISQLDVQAAHAFISAQPIKGTPLSSGEKLKNMGDNDQPIINWNHVNDEQEMMPSESARLRLNNFREELQNLKLNKMKHDKPAEFLRSRHLYTRPSIVHNAVLLKDGRSMNLKENIIEHFDFEAVSPSIWKLIYSWYSADWCIMRYLKRDRVNTYGVVLDLYPEANFPGMIVIDQTDEESLGDNG